MFTSSQRHGTGTRSATHLTTPQPTRTGLALAAHSHRYYGSNEARAGVMERTHGVLDLCERGPQGCKISFAIGTSGKAMSQASRYAMDRFSTPTLGLGREHNHADRPIDTPLALVPCDEDHATLLISGRIHNRGYIVGQPGISGSDAAIMHVVTEIRGNEVVTGHGVVLQVRSEFRVGPGVRDAVRGSRAQRVGHIVEENKRIVLGGVLIDGG